MLVLNELNGRMATTYQKFSLSGGRRPRGKLSDYTGGGIDNAIPISEADREEMLPSGKPRTFDNRVAWARTYLNKAGLIKTSLRGKYCITEEEKISTSYDNL